MSEPSQTADLEAQFRWLIDNSDGVVGLRLDGGMMPWREVVKLYLPHYEPPPIGRSEGVDDAR